MSILFELPAIVRILLVFVAILLAIRIKLSLGNAFLLGSVALGLLFGYSAKPIAISIFQSVIEPKTLSLALIVSLILVLSNSMELTGQMRRMLHYFNGLMSDSRINLMIFPSLIGLLPMPGGAVFSAPMVKELGKDLNLTGAQLSYINYWFRHVWEYCWPLYPGILLATVLTDIDFISFVGFMSPVTILALLMGYIPLLGNKQLNRHEARQNNKPIRPFLKELSPIVNVIVVGLSLGTVLSILFPELSISKEIGLNTALCISIIWVWKSNRLPLHQIWALLKSPQIVQMIYMVFTIIIFKGILEDTQAARLLSEELIHYRIPLVLIAMVLPFIVGMITGYTLAFVGVSLPILIPLMNASGEMAFVFPYVMLVIISGFIGVLLSPLHLCFILSNEYFKTTYTKVYKYLSIPCIGIMTAGVAYFAAVYGLIQN